MKRNVLNIALALVLSAVASVAALAGHSDAGADTRLPHHPIASPSVEVIDNGDEVRAVDTGRLDPEPSTPSWFAAAPEGGSTPLPSAGALVARGRRSISEARALGDARRHLEQAVSEWLAPEVPTDWQPPADRIDAIIRDRFVQAIAVDPQRLGLDPVIDVPDHLYVAAIRADLSPEARADLIRAHKQQVGTRRMTMLGGAVGFALACLAILAVYIRADEATRGYYTNRLRLLAVASAGAAGVAIYRILV